MGKNIIICSDGTGNRGGKAHGTNVWRIYKAVNHNRKIPKQITYYDDGVGTEGVRWWRLVTGAVGLGLARNIREAYAFLAMNYKPGDKIFLFGFSRGAFTVRSLAGLVCKCGLPTRDALLKAGHKREAILRHILKAYRSVGGCKARKYLKKAKELGANRSDFQHIDIHFIGVWDTVDAVGLPFDELKQIISCLWSKIVRTRLWNFRDYRLHRRVLYAYQALALDDERKTFHPEMWETTSRRVAHRGGARRQTVDQVWFAGAHSNVGGGYPKDSPSFVTLDWMMGKAQRCGLRFFPGAKAEVQQNADVHGRLYDSRAGWGAFYRPALRNLYECRGFHPRIHRSVFQRIKRGTQYYAPKAIKPGKFTVV